MKFEFSVKAHDDGDFGYIVESDRWPTVEDLRKILDRLSSDTKIDEIKIWRIIGEESLPSTKL